MPQNCLKREFITKGGNLCFELTEWEVFIGETIDACRIQSKRVDDVVSNVVFLEDVEIVSDQHVDFFELCPLDEEREE